MQPLPLAFPPGPLPMWEPDNARVRCQRFRISFTDGEQAVERLVVSIVVRGPEMSQNEESQLFCEACADV